MTGGNNVSKQYLHNLRPLLAEQCEADTVQMRRPVKSDTLLLLSQITAENSSTIHNMQRMMEVILYCV